MSSPSFAQQLLSQTAISNFEDIPVWHAHYRTVKERSENTIEQAMLGAQLSHSLSYAFLCGYQAAISYLFESPMEQLSAVCITEQAGNHPRAIETTLKPLENGRTQVTGEKTFVTGGTQAEVLYIAAKEGIDQHGRPVIRMLKVDAKQKGVYIAALPKMQFIPEVEHGLVKLDGVQLDNENILTGDGYSQFVKPFRTVEDLHVQAAVTSMLLAHGLRQHLEPELCERWLALALAYRGLSDFAIDDPALHLALAGNRQQLRMLISMSEEAWKARDSGFYEAWKRDKALLNIASKAHQKRTENAWELIAP